MLSCAIAELGIFSATALLYSTLQIMYPNTIGSEYYDVAFAIKKVLLVACSCPCCFLLLLFKSKSEILQIKQL